MLRRLGCVRLAHVVRLVVLGVALAVVGCRHPSRSDGRYLVTTAPIDVGVRGGAGLCLAVDPTDSHGIWWWEPGASGCATRSTGPEVFHADRATVSRSTESEALTLAFRLQLHSATPPSYLEVPLVVEGNHMRSLDHRARVAVHRRQDLDVPWEVPRPR
jgi:hypothetical protein